MLEMRDFITALPGLGAELWSGDLLALCQLQLPAHPPSFQSLGKGMLRELGKVSTAEKGVLLQSV